MTHLEVFTHRVLEDGRKEEQIVLFDYHHRDPLTGNARICCIDKTDRIGLR